MFTSRVVLSFWQFGALLSSNFVKSLAAAVNVCDVYTKVFFHGYCINIDDHRTLKFRNERLRK
jgi:hypothetical protein